MVFKGIVENGSIKLPPEADLPDGTEVRIEPVEEKPLLRLQEGLDELE